MGDADSELEALDREDVAARGRRRIVATLEFLQHASTKWGHRNLLSVTPTLIRLTLCLTHQRKSAAPAV